MLNPPAQLFPQLPHAIHPLRTALALGCSALALIGCGGGSDDAPPPSPAPTLAAPTNFTYEVYLRWTATPGATHYELYVDPDGPGPLPESKAPARDDNGGNGFSVDAYSKDSQMLMGSFYDGNFKALGLATTINATYRLRACDAQGCGSFTAPIGQEYSYELPSGRVPISHSQSKDGLTLAIRHSDYDKKIYEVVVFTRSSLAHPWQQQAVLPSGYGSLALSDDGNTLATTGSVPSEGTSPASTRTRIYQRSGTTWSEQASLDYSNLRADCLLQPCGAGVHDSKLSADGNVLAQSISFYTPATGKYTAGVVIHARSGATWSQQALLETGDHSAYIMALARDGKTLAVNQGSDYSPPSFALVFAQQSNGTWSQQARIPVGTMYMMLGVPPQVGGMQLSDDGNTLAVLALHWSTSGPAVQAADLSCDPMSGGGLYMTLFTRNGTAWQRQAAILPNTSGRRGWALARDGNALLYDNELFTRSNGVWTCP